MSDFPDPRSKLIVNKKQSVDTGAIPRRRNHMLGVNCHRDPRCGFKAELDPIAMFFRAPNLMAHNRRDTADDPGPKMPS